MADSKISALPASTTPLAGTEVLPIVQSSTTKKVSVANLTDGRVVGGASFQSSFSGTTSWSSNDSSAYSYTPYTTDLAVQNTAATAANRFAGLFLQSGTSTYRTARIAAVSDATTYGAKLAIATRNGTSGNMIEGLNVDSSQNVNLTVGNLVQGTAAKGVNFTANTPAAGMTSQLLNWYEEGTFTATLTATTTGPTTPITSTAYYTRVGRLVTVNVQFENVDTTGASGNLRITGLPFAAAAGVPVSNGAVSMFGFGSAPANVHLIAGNSYFQIVDAVTTSYIPIAAGASKYIYASVTYFA